MKDRVRKPLLGRYNDLPKDVRQAIKTWNVEALRRCKQRCKGSHLDHKHGTEHSRGILCHNCNVSLGLLKDNPETILQLAAYITQWNASQVCYNITS